METRGRRVGREPSACVVLSVVALFLFASGAPLGAQQGPPEVVSFEIAKMIIEFNSSANEGVGDVGIQVSLDGDAWKSLTMTDLYGRKILDIGARKSLGKQGLTELFFESDEPSLDEVPLEDFLDRFPEGEYQFEGRTIEGEKITGTAAFTHVIPAGPVIVEPDEGDVVNPSNVVIEWEPVTTKIAGSGPLVVVAYQVIVEGGDPSRQFQVTVAALPTNMTVTVPPQFLEPGTDYAFEVLTIEVSGNQTITEGSFATTP